MTSDFFYGSVPVNIPKKNTHATAENRGLYSSQDIHLMVTMENNHIYFSPATCFDQGYLQEVHAVKKAL